MSVKSSWARNEVPRVNEVPQVAEAQTKEINIQDPGLDSVSSLPKNGTAGSDARGGGTSPFVPGTEKERKLVREQLERILSSLVFRNSKRYASILKYVVTSTLEGNGDQLKERTIGTDVFGRAHDYDTGSDHAVRSAMGEVRRRLAQYYQEEGTSGELRIELQAGSYVPQFRRTRAPDSPSALVEPEVSHANVISLPAPGDQSNARLWIRRSTYALLSIVTVVAALFLYFGLKVAGARANVADPIEDFWGPVLASKGPILLCIGNLEGRQFSQDQGKTGAPLTLLDFHSIPSETVHVSDAATLSRVAALIERRGKQFQIVAQSEATFTDLQNNPAVLIGLMNNDWTERLVQKLRFTVEHPPGTFVMIRDHENPSKNDWTLDYSAPYLDVTRDYALVLRITDPKTDQWVVAVAGISVFGTRAAGEFLTNPNEIQKIQAIAPKGWKQKNLELVLSTEVIRGKPGRASIVASSFW